jgi:hypothetical protein
METRLNLRGIGSGLIFDNRYNYSGARLTIIPTARGRRLDGIDLMRRHNSGGEIR